MDHFYTAFVSVLKIESFISHSWDHAIDHDQNIKNCSFIIKLEHP